MAECVGSSHGWSNFVGRLISPLTRETRAPSPSRARSRSGGWDPMKDLLSVLPSLLGLRLLPI